MSKEQLVSLSERISSAFKRHGVSDAERAVLLKRSFIFVNARYMCPCGCGDALMERMDLNQYIRRFNPSQAEIRASERNAALLSEPTP